MPDLFERWMQRVRNNVDRLMHRDRRRRTTSGGDRGGGGGSEKSPNISDEEQENAALQEANNDKNPTDGSRRMSPIEAEFAARYRYGDRRKSVSAERYDPEKDVNDNEPAPFVHPKSDEQRERLKAAIKGILILASLDAEQTQQLLDAMFERNVKKGDRVIEVGDDGDNFYIIDSGTFDILVPIDGVMNKVAQYDNKGAFGELALMYNQPRSATVVATSPGRLWALDRKSFRKIVIQSAFKRRKMYEALLQKVDILAALTPAERTNLADALTPKTFSRREAIIRQGDESDGMYFVVDGSCRVEIQPPNAASREAPRKVITTLGKGAYFGELGLINSKPRAASVIAADAPTLLLWPFSMLEHLSACWDRAST